MSEPKRRLPVLRNTPAEEEGDPPRPRWQWIAFGVLATVGVWMPMQYVGEAIAGRAQRAFLGDPPTLEAFEAAFAALSRSDYVRLVVTLAAVRLVPFFVAPLAGGYLVGRWGPESVGVREAAISGVATAIAVMAISILARQPVGLFAPIVMVVVLVPMAALGGRLGLARRKREMTPNVK